MLGYLISASKPRRLFHYTWRAPQMNFRWIPFSRKDITYSLLETWQQVQIGDAGSSSNFSYKLNCVSVTMPEPRIYDITKTNLSSWPSAVKCPSGWQFLRSILMMELNMLTRIRWQMPGIGESIITTYTRNIIYAVNQSNVYFLCSLYKAYALIIIDVYIYASKITWLNNVVKEADGIGKRGIITLL